MNTKDILNFAHPEYTQDNSEKLSNILLVLQERLKEYDGTIEEYNHIQAELHKLSSLIGSLKPSHKKVA